MVPFGKSLLLYVTNLALGNLILTSPFEIKYSSGLWHAEVTSNMGNVQIEVFNLRFLFYSAFGREQAIGLSFAQHFYS